jgi:hypothetical protein
MAKSFSCFHSFEGKDQIFFSGGKLTAKIIIESAVF